MNYLNKLKNKKIAILGIGYLGSNIYKFLENKKKELPFELIAITKENLKIIETEAFDYLINCAGNSGDFREDIIGTIDSNICLLIYLLKNLKIRCRYLTISSTRVYGFSNVDNVEYTEDDLSCSDHLSLDFIYDGSKKLIESILINCSKNLSYKISIVRLSNIYGKFNKLDDTTLIKKAIKCSKNKEILETSENRKSEKDYIYIDDAIEGILKSLLIPTGNNIFNIASGKSASIENIKKVLNIKVKYLKENKTKFSKISIKKAMAELNFKPKTDLKTGLQKVINQEGCANGSYKTI